MRPIELVRPLEGAWNEVLDAVLRERGGPAFADTARLAPKVEEASRLYNAGLAGTGARAPVEARIAFSFPRDVPKGAAAVRELLVAGALPARSPGEARPLRIVDLGAGLGATTWGIARAAAAHAAAAHAAAIPPIHALLVDDDAEALAVAAAIARHARRLLGPSAPVVELETRTAPLAPGMKLPPADVVVLGQVLSELDRDLPPEARAAKHAALLADLLDRVVVPDGSLVVVEPALRERARHLHAVRDVLAAQGRTIFAPCLHAAACPALALPGEWCHDDLEVDLPPWLVPLARAAGLRWQGLSFAHLVLRRDALRLGDVSAAAGGRGPNAPRLHLRVISDLMVTKGKVELFGCTAGGERVRLRRLDRDAPDRRSGEPDRWRALRRGDVVVLSAPERSPLPSPVPSPFDRGRIGADTAIDVWPTRK